MCSTAPPPPESLPEQHPDDVARPEELNAKSQHVTSNSVEVPPVSDSASDVAGEEVADTTPEAVLRSGFLEKKGNKPPVKGWRKRYFSLSVSSLTYAKMEGGVPIGAIPTDAIVACMPVKSKKAFEFQLLTRLGGRTYTLRALEESDRAEWIAALGEFASTLDSEPPFPSDEVAGTSGRKMWNSSSGLKQRLAQEAADRAVVEARLSELQIQFADLSFQYSDLNTIHERLLATTERMNASLTEYVSKVATLEDDKENMEAQLGEARDEAERWRKMYEAERLKTWVQNNERTACTRCQKRFSVRVRRHHCRLCGEIFCGPCSNVKVPMLHGSSKKVRACQKCADGFLALHRGRSQESGVHQDSERVFLSDCSDGSAEDIDSTGALSRHKSMDTP